MSNRLTTWELKAVDNLGDTIKRMEQIAQLMAQQNQLSASTNAAISSQLSKLTGDYANLQKSIANQNTEMQKSVTISQQTRQETERMRQQFEAMKTTTLGLGSIIAGVFTGAKVKEFLSDVIDANTKVSLFSRSLETMLQNKQKADEIAAYALSLSQRSPFEVKDIIEVTQRLIAMGAESGKVTTYLEMLGELSSVVGTQKLPLIAKALLDVQNKQVLYAQEVRQFTDNGIPLFQLLADSMDLPISKVKKLADEHEITFRDVEKALLQATQEGGKYYGMMALQADSLGGKLSNLKDVVYLAKARFGEYIKDGLGTAITWTSELVKSITSTDASMGRLVDGVKSITTAFISYVAATRSGAVIMATVTAAQRAWTIVVGTSHIALQALTGAMGAHITITTAASVAARTFWATLAANPIGLVIGAVGLVTSAYYAWRAATGETSVAIGENTGNLIKEKIALTEAVKEVQGYSIGTEQRTKAVEALMAKYPGLLAYVDADKVTNNQLNRALEQQIKLLDLKIKYSAAAAQADAVYDKQKQIYAEQFEIIIKLRDSYKDLSAAYPDNAKFIAALEKVNKNIENVQLSSKNASVGIYGVGKAFSDSGIDLGQYNRLTEQAAAMQSQLSVATIEVSKASSQSTNAQIRDIERQLAELEKAHRHKRVTDDEYKVSRQKLMDELARLNGEEVDSAAAAAAALGNIGDGKKAKAVLTEREIAVLKKEIQQDSFKDQLKLIDAQMNLEIERVNHTKITKEQAEKAIIKIVKDAEEEKNALRAKFANFVLEGYKEEVISSRDLKEAVVFDEKEKAKAQKKAEEEKRAEAKKTVQEWESYQKEMQRISKETTDVETKSRRESLNMLLSFVSSLDSAFADVAKVGKKVIDDIDLLSGKSTDYYVKEIQHNSQMAEEAARTWGTASEQYTQLKVRGGELNKGLEETKAAASQATLGIAMMAFDLIKNVGEAINTMLVETNNAIIKAYDAVRDANSQLYSSILKNNEEIFKQDFANFKGTYVEKEKIIEEHYAKQKAIAERRDIIDAEAARAQKILEIDNSMHTSIMASDSNTITAMIAGIHKMEAFEAQVRINKLNAEIANAEQIRDAKIAALQTELEEFRKAKEEEIRIENEALVDRLKANEQFYSDKQIRLVNDDTYRSELLAAGEAREVKALEDARDREVKRAEESNKTAEEIARIKNAFNASIAEVHAKYQQAIGDKEKEISLANIESKAQETDKKNALEKESKDTIDGYKDAIKAKDSDTNAAMAAANNDYKNAVNAANRQIFELTKAMKIAELQAEIAILRGKRNLFNRGKIDSAIDDLNSAIGDIRGLSFDAPTTGSGSSGGNPNPNPSPDPVTGGGGDPGSGSNPSNPTDPSNPNPESPKTEQYFVGTPYIEGIGYPDGRDTVPAMVNKGERIMQTHLNALIGGREVSNEEVAAKKLFADHVLAKVAGIHKSLHPTTFLAPLPEVMLRNAANSDPGAIADRLAKTLLTNGNNFEALADKIAEAMKRPSVNIEMTPRGMNVKERGEHNQNVTYYENQSYNRELP